MPIVWPEKCPARTSSVLRKSGYQFIDAACQSLSRERNCLPIFVSECGEVITEFSNFIHETWLYSGKLKSKKTISTYAESLDSWLRFTEVRSINWAAAGVRDVAEYRNWMAGTDVGVFGSPKLSNRTINLRLAVVREFYRYLWKECVSGEVGVSYSVERFRSIMQSKNMALRVNKRRPRVISDANCSLMLSGLNGSHRIIFMWMICTGLRISSVLSISLSCFMEFVRGSDNFISVWVKGGKHIDVYVPDIVVRETLRYIKLSRVLVAVEGVEESALFLNARGRAVSRHCFYKAFKLVSNNLGLELNPHNSRSTYASKLVSNLGPVCEKMGFDSIKVVQTLLGHSSSETTKDYVDSLSICSLDILQALSETVGELVGD